jgi:acyl carrier protein
VPGISIEEIPEMSTEEIRIKVKKSIAKIANINLDEIPDNASYKDDLQLDSLTILEIAVDAEYQFQVKLSDDDLGVLRTVDDTVKMVQHYLSPVMA